MTNTEQTPHVAILMATYNGSKYLPHQIDSILKQHYTNWTLYVQDDLSTDNTPEILADYAKRDARIKVVDNQENWSETKLHDAHGEGGGRLLYVLRPRR